jgi:hypothetical protein
MQIRTSRHSNNVRYHGGWKMRRHVTVRATDGDFMSESINKVTTGLTAGTERPWVSLPTSQYVIDSAGCRR